MGNSGSPLKQVLFHRVAHQRQVPIWQLHGLHKGRGEQLDSDIGLVQPHHPNAKRPDSQFPTIPEVLKALELEKLFIAEEIVIPYLQPDL
ncbi:unnamed protein product [Linum trigynum]|uniref:Uncharacterized protein n=1 Tax=Linum trigynum TaxID=586398 RepID=A0AAV2E5W0_9ROSI